jgi:hypothetical protein
MPDTDKLLAAIEERESTAYGTDSDPTAVERSRAIDYYLGRPFGNEVEGRSQVVSKDVSDTIEWIKPSLLNIFAGGEEVVKFDPIGEEDEEAAKQETDFTNHVVQRKNPWFMTAYTWFTDALMTRNAYVLAHWEKKQDVGIEKYRGLTDDQMALIVRDEEVQIVAHSAYPAQPLAPLPVDPMGQPMMQPMLHDVDLRRVKNYGCTKIEVLPPERCLVAENTKTVSVRNSEFFEFWDYKSISSLREDGFDVPDDIDDSGSVSETLIDQARDIDRQTSAFDQTEFVDHSMRKVKVRMVWIRHDYDEDGIAELNYVVVVGKTPLYREEVDSIPVATLVPTPFPHRHMGLSIYDAIADLQLIKSAMLRQIVDNTYLQNNGRYAVSDKVNLDDMLTSRPGGLVRVKGGMPANEIMPLTHPFMATQAINVVEYIDQIRQNRTGTSQYFTGVDQNALNKTASGIAQLSTAAAQRVELIARVFAETGVSELFQIVHELTLKNSTSQEKIKLRGQWVTVDPRQWRKRTDMTISVGLGAGNRQSQMVSLQLILTLMKEALPLGLTTPSKIYNALTELTKAAGFTNGGAKFWNDPGVNPPPEPQPDPKILIEAERVQVEKGRLALDEKVAEHDARMKEERMLLDREKAAAEVGLEDKGLEVEREKAALTANVQLQSKQSDIEDRKEARKEEKPPVSVQVNAESAFKEMAEKFAKLSEEQAKRHEEAMSQMKQLMDAEEVVVRDKKTGKAVGKKRVPAGTLQ